LPGDAVVPADAIPIAAGGGGAGSAGVVLLLLLALLLALLLVLLQRVAALQVMALLLILPVLRHTARTAAFPLLFQRCCCWPLSLLQPSMLLLISQALPTAGAVSTDPSSHPYCSSTADVALFSAPICPCRCCSSPGPSAAATTVPAAAAAPAVATATATHATVSIVEYLYWVESNVGPYVSGAKLLLLLLLLLLFPLLLVLLIMTRLLLPLLAAAAAPAPDLPATPPAAAITAVKIC
jgi:hypothetical protein